jgi:hypothetical protein
MKIAAILTANIPSDFGITSRTELIGGYKRAPEALMSAQQARLGKVQVDS